MAQTKKIGIINSSATQLADIKYTSRDFASLKNDFIQRWQKYFPESGTDISQGSGAQVLLDLVAYASDVLHFYLDKQFNELFLSRTLETTNAYDLANALSYQPKPLSPAIADLTIQFDIPVTGSLTSQYYFNIQKSTRFIVGSQPDIIFENIEPIIFNSENQNSYSQSVVTRTDNIVVTRFSRSGIKVISGITKLFQKKMDSSDGFKKIHIEDRSGINDVINVFDSDGSEWIKVRNLSQEFVFTGTPNTDVDTTDVPYMLTVKRVPKRFALYYNADGTADLTFGFGEVDLNESEFILSPENFVFPNKTIGKFLNFLPDNIQLEDFLNTSSLGVSPRDTTMQILYRSGGGVRHNIGKGLINTIQNLNIQFYSLLLNSTQRQFVTDSFVVTNPEPSQGGANPESIDQVRINASYAFASQDRVVTIQDYVARVASIPPQYGTIYKVIAKKTKDVSTESIKNLSDKVDLLLAQRATGIQDDILKKQIEQINAGLKNKISDIILYVIAQDSNGYLQKATSTLKKNILTYLNFYSNDRIEIQDLKELNLGCRFTIHTDSRLYNPAEVLLNTMNFLKSEFALSNMEIGKGINLDEIRSKLKNPENVKGIISIPSLEFFTIKGINDGRSYSNDFNESIDSFYDYSKTIINIPNDTIISFKYLNNDIIGRTSE